MGIILKHRLQPPDSRQNVHTIGDRAVHVVLDAFDEIVNTGVPTDRLFRLEHAQIMTVNDLARAVKLGVIASYQPTHATSDVGFFLSPPGALMPPSDKSHDRCGMRKIAWDRSGLRERTHGSPISRGLYFLASMILVSAHPSTGGRIALGSDFPVESIDPLKGFYAAVTRLDESGDSPHGKNGWFSHEKLSREQTLRGMTVDGEMLLKRFWTCDSDLSCLRLFLKRHWLAHDRYAI